ncbi:hypothetical protein A2335_04230 [Candidatus Peregrinibacteria bacterium RIFOXYB2_FULL_32_7]|nr:MAG: hypothetical protein A2335_04230 [Candidatus Peregrinibacteria bacterium RIFOXYB2_FULL_32_7]
MKNKFIKLLKQFLFLKKFEAIRYLIIGGSCSVGHIIFLYFLTDIVGIFYLYSTIISFVFISFLGYFGQKYFTYRNFESKHVKQFSLYWFFIIIGLIMDASLMFFFVSIIGIYYIVASIITRFIIFAMNFLLTKYVVFKS